MGHTALVIGSSGGIGAALIDALNQHPQYQSLYSQILCLSRGTTPALDYAFEPSLKACASWVSEQCQEHPLRLIIVATGFLHHQGLGPERRVAQLDADYLAKVFLVNAIGPALVCKHFDSLLPKDAPFLMAMLSAKVGSVGDNALGGWLGYRASKAALNQVVKTASIEWERRNKQSICVAVHPGTVATRLSDPFGKTGLMVRPPAQAAQEILQVLHTLGPQDNGSFVSYDGKTLPW
jgi:NAD(P)-dependent dehydrogenase (short-subunit alcohol dehydrogenase family)